MDWMSFGRKVRERRIEENWSQEELASRAKLSRNYLSQIERGDAENPSWDVVQRLATVLGLGPDVLEGRQIPVNLPPGLEEFARQQELPPEDIEMLARIQYRGQHPKTAMEWDLLYRAIKMVTQGG